MSIYNKSESEWLNKQINDITILKKIGEYEFTASHKCGKTRKNYTYKADYLLVRCNNCNTERKTKSRSLINNQSKGCRHCAQRQDAIGRRQGSLVVDNYEFGQNSKGRPVLFYLCSCDCGGKHKIKADIFNYGECISCKSCRKSNKYIKTNSKINLKRYFNKIKNNSKKRLLEFNIHIDYIEQLLLNQNYLCNLSGITIKIEDGTASLDRIDSSKGYTEDNVQWVHRTINFMKNELQESDFIYFCSRVHKNHDLSIS